MDMTEAIEKFGRPVNPISVDELAQRLSIEHSGNMQRQATASRAVGLVNEGLALLASLGHQFDIVDRIARAELQFPKMLYRRTPQGGVEELTVHSGAELDEHLDGGEWSEAPSGEPKARAKPKAPNNDAAQGLTAAPEAQKEPELFPEDEKVEPGSAGPGTPGKLVVGVGTKKK